MRVELNKLNIEDYNQALRTYGSKLAGKVNYDLIKEKVFEELSFTKPLPILDYRSILSNKASNNNTISSSANSVSSNVINLSEMSKEDVFSKLEQCLNEVPSGVSDSLDNYFTDNSSLNEEDDLEDFEFDEEDIEDLEDILEDDNLAEEDEFEEDFEDEDFEEEDLEDDFEEEPLDDDFEDEDLEDDEFEYDDDTDDDFEDGNDSNEIEWDEDEDDDDFEEEPLDDDFEEEPLDEDDDFEYDSEDEDVLELLVDENEGINDDLELSELEGLNKDNHINEDVVEESLDSENVGRIIEDTQTHTHKEKAQSISFDLLSSSDDLSLDFIKGVMDEPKNKETKKESDSHKPKLENTGVDEENLPANPIEFLRRYPRSLESLVKQYYPPKEVDKYINRGLIQKSRGKLFI